MKLSKAQAQFLIEKLECSAISKDSYPSIRDIINQCTEKEFPGFCINVYEPNEIEKNEIPDTITIKQYGDHSSAISFIYSDRSGINQSFEFLIPIYKFSQFTEGCNKVVEYLNEQD